MTGTFDAVWKDKLLSWDGVSMTYDGCGNMLTKGSTSYTWTQGRKLAGVSNGKSIQYQYDHTGNRVKKVVDGVTTEYRMAGSLLLSEKRADDTLQFHYDTNANQFSVLIDGSRYLYVKNIQNDIIGLLDVAGNLVVEYKYDSWGNTVSITGILADTVSVKNPFRYRGYYLDAETGLYYVGSRYYDPGLGRFLNADGFVSTGTGILGHNMFAYCNDNPINMSDSDGNNPTASSLLSVLGGMVIADGPLPVGDVLSVVVAIGVIGAKIYQSTKTKDIERKEEKIKVEVDINSSKKQAYFPRNPYQFNPKGLTMNEYSGTKNGRIIKWRDPLSNVTIFEWNEDFKMGAHYHAMMIEWDGKHMGLHYYPGDIVPEPWNSIYFGG